MFSVPCDLIMFSVIFWMCVCVLFFLGGTPENAGFPFGFPKIPTKRGSLEKKADPYVHEVSRLSAFFTSLLRESATRQPIHQPVASEMFRFQLQPLGLRPLVENTGVLRFGQHYQSSMVNCRVFVLGRMKPFGAPISRHPFSFLPSSGFD